MKFKTYLLLLGLVSCGTHDKEKEIRADQFKGDPAVPEARKESEGKLYVQKVMDACGAKLSSAKREILAEQIRLVGEAYFKQKEEQHWFYFLICIESKFNSEARSPVGATGLTQVMPRYANEFAKSCGLGELDGKDLLDSQVNLLVGACRFRELMLHYEGDPTLALAAYNSGMDSSTVRKAASSDVRTGHPETVGYLAAAFVLEQRMKKEASQDGGPSSN
jgi:hypothetical protein